MKYLRKSEQGVHPLRVHALIFLSSVTFSYFLAEFGDFCPEDHGNDYLDGFQFVPNQTASLIRKITELHKLHQ